MAELQAYPLCWPQGWKRVPASERKNGSFNKKQTEPGRSYASAKWLTVTDGVGRVLSELQKMGVDRQDVILSTNVRTRLDGMPRSGESEPTDPGAAVYWRDNQTAPMRCMAVDRYTTVADNLAAIGATLEAMRAIERHGGAEILDRAFTGFAALPSTTDGPSWWTTLDVSPHATVEEIETAFRKHARTAHPDVPGGSETAMQVLNLARDQALAAARGKGGA